MFRQCCQITHVCREGESTKGQHPNGLEKEQEGIETSARLFLALGAGSMSRPGIIRQCTVKDD